MSATQAPPRPAATRPAAEGHPPAALDRRFYAFTVDRAVAWTIEGLALVTGWRLAQAGRTGAGVVLAVGAVLLVLLVFSLLLGLRGSSPGKALLGLRAVGAADGTPIGVARALVRSAVVGLATLPTLGIGVACLAWTALADPGRRRRGWHDLRTGSVVVDVRPVPVVVEEETPAPQPIVNLTAMRLVPAEAPAPASPTPPPAPAAAPAPTPTPDQAPHRVEGRRRNDRVEPAPAAPQVLAGPLRGEPPASPLGSPPVVEPTRPVDVARAAPRWRVTVDTGESLVVDGVVLLGRRPEPRPGEDVRHLVPLPSSDMSLSKTHAQLQVAGDGVLVVVDRGSTNGTVVVRSGVPRELSAGRPTTLLDGDQVRLGDRLLTVSTDG